MTALDSRPAVLFLGDSLIGGGDWAAAFPGYRTANHGVGGDTTRGVLARVPEALGDPALAGGPVAVVLMVGTNDLTQKVPAGEIAAGVAAILERLTALAPGVRVIVTSVPPRTGRLRGKLRTLNEALAQVAAGAGAVFLDLWPVLADEDGRLRGDLTRDGLHLTEPGYAAWVSLLTPVLASVAAD